LTSESKGQDSRAELFEAIGHPTRIKILQVLDDEPMGFADLKRAVGVESSGNMSFHLTKLRDLVKTAPDGNYVLTDDGREALWSVGNITGIRNEPGPGLHIRRTGRTRQRVIISLLLAIVLLLGSVEAFQQEQLAMQEDQIASEQGLIGLYVNQAHPFANGQSASLVLGQDNFSSRRPTTSQNGISNPSEALFDSSGNLWVVESSNFRIVEFKPSFSDGMRAYLVLGQKNFTTAIPSTSKDGFGVSTGLLHGGRVSLGPSGATFDSLGNLWVADVGNNRVLEFKPPFATGMPASLVLGQGNFSTGFRGDSDRGLSYPTQTAFDSLGNLWVMDSGNNRVLEFKFPFANGINASLVIGQPDFVGNLPSISQSGFDSLAVGSDLAFDPSGDLWVGDQGNNRVLEFEPPFSNGMNATLVIGQTSFTSNIGFIGYDPRTNLGFAIAFDTAGNLWATFRNRVLEFRPPFGTNLQASLEIGQPDLTSTAWVGGRNGLASPAHPGFDSSGNIWVPDGNNNRVLEFVIGYYSAPNISSLNPMGQIFRYLPSIGVVSALAVGAIIAFVSLRKGSK
jgi:DNA-binding transcriptional ArsR family regulator